jgi:hypothetical protein
MIYTTNDGQLLSIRTAVRLLDEIQEIPDPIIQSEALTEAQIILTAFVLELKLIAQGKGRPYHAQTSLNEMPAFDA